MEKAYRLQANGKRCVLVCCIIACRFSRISIKFDQFCFPDIGVTSNQERRVILYLYYIPKLGYKSAVVRTSDTYRFFIILYHGNRFP